MIIKDLALLLALGALGRERSNRVLNAIHVLRGLPLGYKIEIDGGIVINLPHTRLDQCKVRNVPEGIKIDRSSLFR